MANSPEPYRDFDSGGGPSLSNNKDNHTALVFSLVALLVALIGLVIGAVSLAQKGTYNYNISGFSSGKCTYLQQNLCHGQTRLLGGER